MATWKFDQPVLFLGKWCLREQDRSIWENMNAVIASPIGENSDERYELFQKARLLEAQLFPRITQALNSFHRYSYDDRYWKIILGHWFRETISLLINRIETIERCFADYKVSSLTIYKNQKLQFAESNYTKTLLTANDNYWNTKLFNRIIDLLGTKNIKIEEIPPIINSVERHPINIRRTKIHKLRKLNFVTNKFARKSDALIINSYLPLKSELFLNMALCQFPQLRISPIVSEFPKINEDIRLILSEQIRTESKNTTELIISSLLFELMPICYLEGFKNLVKASESTGWPSDPKFIFSSNNFVSDDVFKVWTAEKVAKGVPYFAGQHGNNYGTNKYLGQTIEEITSDKFLTWGWKQKLPQHTPAFIFKNVSNPPIQDFKVQGIILIENLLIPRIQVWDQAAEFDKYMLEQFRFVTSINGEIRDYLTVRLHVAHTEMLGEDELRWLNFDEKIKLDRGEAPIRELWLNNRLIVHSYDSTGMLETLEANRPTIAFWQGGLDHLVEDAIPYYQLLIDAGIVYLTPESAALKINQVWNEVENWWKSREVQDAREIFCHQYARSSKKPIRDLKKILLENL